MTVTDFHAFKVAWQQRYSNTNIFLVAQKTFWVKHAERQTNNGRNRCQSDVTLFKVQFQTQNFFAFPSAFTYNTNVWQRSSVGTSTWASQTETWDLTTVSQAWQVVIFLILSTVLKQQLTWAERVRNTHGREGSTRDSQCLKNSRLSLSRETKTAVFFRNDHREETFFLDVVPDFLREVTVLADFPLIYHRAQSCNLVVQEVLFFFRNSRVRVVQQHLPVRLT